MEIIVNIPLRLSVKLSVNGSARVVLGSNQVSLNSQEYQRSSFSFFGKTVNIWSESFLWSHLEKPVNTGQTGRKETGNPLSG